MKSSPVEPGDVLAGKYRVERVLGEGGMGVVVAAFHLELEQLVAVKFLLPQFVTGGEAAVRFRREARAAVKIKNEHVARVIDVGTMDDDVPFMVMEYLDGHDLAQELLQRERLPVEEAVSYLLQANEAIAEAHSVGIVHRDLKPANLFLANRPGGTRIIKVLDFGISKLVTAGSSPSLALTRTQSMMGSPLYMSPEQLESTKDVDPRADIWSIGVILHELLHGKPPFAGDTMPQLVRSVLSGKRSSLVDLVGAPPELEAVVQRCLAVDKKQRFENIAELSHALVPFGHEQAVMSAARASRVLGTGGSAADTGERHSTVERARTQVDPSRKSSQGTSASYAGVESVVPQRSRSTALVAGALLAALAAGAILYSTQGSDDVSTSAATDEPASDEPRTNDVPVATPPVVEPPAPVVSAAAPAASTRSDEPSALAGATQVGDEPSEPAADPAPTAPTPVAKPAPRPAPRPKATTASPAKHPPASSKPAASSVPPKAPTSHHSLPDFGGRR